MEEIRFDPIERKEFFLAKLGGQEVTPPDAVTRIERYLQDIIDGNASTIPPVTRIEYYLAKISGADVEVPDPETRTEYYLAKIAGMDVEQPDPITRLDYFLAQWIETGGGVLETVTGNAPITLTNALAKAMVSLTRYGLCTQASTPTPSDPVPIKCNNGVLKLVDDELPAGFKRLASIKFDGDFWYETGEVMTGNDDVTMTLSGTVTTGQNVFGSYNGTSSGTKNFSLFLYGNGSSSNCYLRYGEQLLRPRFGSGERTITFGKSGTSGFYTDATAEPDTFTTVAVAYIGMLPNSSSPAYTGSIVGNILVGTRLKWIPCERESDGVVGYYEAVKGVFLEPVGTGTPVKGAYDFSLSHIEAVGTPEVLTVGGVNLLNAATNTTGKYIAIGGNITDGDGQYTDLIPVTVGNLYVCAFTSARNSGINRLHGYNSNGTWVKQLSYATATGMQGKKVALSALIPSGISYIRLSYGQTDTDAIISQEPIPSNEFYVGRVGIGTKAYINSLESTITSPYSASAYHGFGIVTPVVPESAYAFTWSGTGLNTYGIGFYASIDDVTDVSKCISGGSIKELSTFVVPSGANYAVLVFANASPKTLTLDYLYVNPAPTYAPYVASQTASVPMLLSVGDYADEAEIISGGVTHGIGIKVLDGTETWTTDTYGGYRRMVLQEVLNAIGDTLSVLCSHYVSRVADARQQPNSIFIANSGKLVIYVDSTQNISTDEEFKSYLAAQYAAGTPVIVVYPLAEATTESVAGQSLSTVAGTNVVSVTADVSPIELEAEYMAVAP